MAPSRTISSAANPLLKDVRRAVGRGGLTDQGWCVAESFHLLEEALRSGCLVKAVLAAKSALAGAQERLAGRGEIQLIAVPDAVMQKVSATQTSQGVLALVRPPEWNFDHLVRGRALVVVLDAMQDPGNAGAILRTAEAFGSSGAVFLKGSVSPYNPKTLRASAGSLFRLPYLDGMEPSDALAALSRNRVQLYAAVPAHPDGSARRLAEVDFARPCALIIGNEGRGVSPEWRSAAVDVSIPTSGVESLNAAVAAGILLYEARRQRSAP